MTTSDFIYTKNDNIILKIEMKQVGHRETAISDVMIYLTFIKQLHAAGHEYFFSATPQIVRWNTSPNLRRFAIFNVLKVSSRFND